LRHGVLCRSARCCFLRLKCLRCDPFSTPRPCLPCTEVRNPSHASIVSGSWRAVANLCTAEEATMHERARCSGGCARHAEASRRRVSRMKSSAKRTSQRAGANMASPPIAVTNKPSHRFSTSQLLTFSTSSLIPLQRFNGSRHRRLNVKCRAQPAQSLLRVHSPWRAARGRRMESTGVERHRLQDPRGEGE
jgi:hypothetical protein